MNVEFSKLCGNEQRKAQILIAKAIRLGMNLSGYWEIGVNRHSGNVYLWLEDYMFSLFIGLHSDAVKVCITNFNNGEEEIFDLGLRALSTLEKNAQRFNKGKGV